MSVENKKTIDVYKEKANIYLNNNIEHEKNYPEIEREKKLFLYKLIKESFKELPPNGKVFEIGSGDGSNSKYIESLGYDVLASDTVNPFLDCLEQRKLKHIQFNVLEDSFPEKYFGIFCWRVFTHFTIDDAFKVIEKVYNSLEYDGIFVFNALNHNKNIDNEWLDYEGEYHIGDKRFFNYFYRNELDEIVKNTNFHIKDFCYEGDNNKWLVYVLKKQYR